MAELNRNGQPAEPYVIPLPKTAPQLERRLSPPNTVYVEMPEIERSEGALANSSQNTRSRQFLLSTESSQHNDTWRSEHHNHNYVEETIFYDPFDDRRIDVAKDRPSRSHQLQLNCSQPSPVHNTTNSPGYSSQPRSIYPTQNTPSDDGFRLTPLPVADILEPPPAYTEIDTRPGGDGIVSSISSCTLGYMPQSPGDRSRKLINCPFCRLKVYTLVVRESGAVTHVIAMITFFFCFLLMFCIYCMDWCKYKNHYCPNCNNLIGYEMPFLCTDMVYVKPSTQST